MDKDKKQRRHLKHGETCSWEEEVSGYGLSPSHRLEKPSEVTQPSYLLWLGNLLSWGLGVSRGISGCLCCLPPITSPLTTTPYRTLVW